MTTPDITLMQVGDKLVKLRVELTDKGFSITYRDEGVIESLHDPSGYGWTVAWNNRLHYHNSDSTGIARPLQHIQSWWGSLSPQNPLIGFAALCDEKALETHLQIKVVRCVKSEHAKHQAMIDALTILGTTL
jgi:hypothetical protein